MEDTNTKKATTVGAYAEDVEFVNLIKGDGRKQADALAEIVADYRRHRSQTAGQGAAEAAVRLIEAQAAKIAEVEFAARTENLATQLEAARADAEHGRGNVAFLSSQADDLRRQLDEARRENDRLRAQLDAREGGGR